MNSKQRRAKKRFSLRLADNAVCFVDQIIEELESGKTPKEMTEELRKNSEHFKKLIKEMK